jgi:homoserine O-succinyltransferase
MGRFLQGQSEVCPTIPRGYFDTEADEILTAFRREALADRRPEFFADFPADQLAKDLRNAWHPPARRIYRNWLLYMASQRAERSRPSALNGRRRRALAGRPDEAAGSDPIAEFGP